jgi:hypothetical protein
MHSGETGSLRSHQRPNQAMQLTASKPVFTLRRSAIPSVCCVAGTEGAVADLGSR